MRCSFPGEKVTVTEIDVGALRAAREGRRGHDLRNELHDRFGRPICPGKTMSDREDHTVSERKERMRRALLESGVRGLRS